MRTGMWMTSIVTLLLMSISIGCEPAAKTNGDAKEKQEGHDGHAEHKEPYHPGHSGYGLVFHTDGLEPALAAKLSGDVGTITIVNQAKADEDYRDTPVAVSEVTVVPPKGSKSDKTFTLPAKNKGSDDKASVFELEDPSLAVVMAGDFTVQFELDGKKHEYEVFEHGH